ncbi:SPOR domain-containing protein [Fulvivirga lutimaris]|uniref:SPOR domain-containing protein n=1 Tax=Fulvivirga lutimaris TaxID=1819566 RepID=UPI001FEBFDD7|nr:SPOR domain-containing protein [Fulvivirga lutimaris]
MKKITLLFTIIMVGAITFNASAQMDKKEKKEWKKKAKEYAKNPEQLKQLVDDNQALQGQVNSLKADNTGLQSKMSDKDAKISELQDDMAKLRSDLAAAKAAAKESKPKPVEMKSGEKMIDGVVFKVQIGAFRNKDLSKYFDNNENFGGESADGTQKITLGQFRDYWEADTFKKYLREMGVKDAWIVPYRDGVRVEIKDVLEGVVTEKPADSE